MRASSFWEIAAVAVGRERYAKRDKEHIEIVFEAAVGGKLKELTAGGEGEGFFSAV